MNAVVTLQNVLTFTFVVSSMLAMGLAHTPREVLAPLRNLRLVAVALLASFVIVPGAAFLLSRITTNPDFATGLILLGAVAGSPFVFKLAGIAEADLSLATGLLVLLAIGTVVYLPLMLPLVLPGVAVEGGAIAIQLSLQLLLPLGIGIAVRARYEEGATSVLLDVQKLANISLVLLLVLMMLMNLGDVLGMFGSGAVLATILTLVIAIAAGWLLGGPRRDQRATVAVVSGQRNFAAAFVVANGSFAAQPDVFVFLAGASIIDLAIMFVFAGEVRRRGRAAGPTPAAEPPGRPHATNDAIS